MAVRQHRKLSRILCLFLGLIFTFVSSVAKSDPPAIPATPSPIPTPSPPQAQDRSQKGGSSSAAAEAGAAMAMASCAMMMMMAQQQEDENSKMMMMMMAMQECAQGAQDMANSDQNKNGGNQLKRADGTQQASIGKPLPSPQPSSSSSNPDLSKLFPLGNDDDNSSPEVASNSPSPEPREKPEPPPDESPEPEGKKGKYELPTTTLGPIDMQKLKFDDANRTEANSGGPSGGGNTVTPSAKNVSPDTGVSPTFGSDGSVVAATRTRKKSEGDAAPGSGGGDGGTEKSAEKDPFESMLSQLMAPKSPFDSMPQFGGSGSDYFGQSKAAARPAPRVTLFQYASLIYKRRAYQDRKLVTKRKTRVANLANAPLNTLGARNPAPSAAIPPTVTPSAARSLAGVSP